MNSPVHTAGTAFAFALALASGACAAAPAAASAAAPKAAACGKGMEAVKVTGIKKAPTPGYVLVDYVGKGKTKGTALKTDAEFMGSGGLVVGAAFCIDKGEN